MELQVVSHTLILVINWEQQNLRMLTGFSLLIASEDDQFLKRFLNLRMDHFS